MRERATSYACLLGLSLCALVLGLGGACQKEKTGEPAAPQEKPTLRIYALSNLAGALEPCGCQKDMLGGVDHLAALVRAGKQEVPSAVVGAGPMFFMDPRLDETRRTQDVWKAKALSESLKDVGLTAWAPGYNDWAAGGAELASLAATSDSALLAANLTGVVSQPVKILELAGTKLGIAGVAEPRYQASLPVGVKDEALGAALVKARDELTGKGAKLLVALVTAPRGDALRLAEVAEGFHVMVVGKPFDQGEANDKPTPPTLVGKTLVLQAQNHAQSVAVVDIYLRGGSFDLQDGSGVEAESERESLAGRIADLERRIPVWEADKSLPPAELKKKQRDLGELKARHQRLSRAEPPKSGSFFRYRLVPVTEGAGEDAQVAARMLGYYKQVNEHNREAFKDRKPPPVPAGESGYVGVEACKGCHEPAHRFWLKTPHSRAYATLVKQHKEFNLDCVSCHVTGYEKPGGSTVTHVKGLIDVQCENCHGPGEAHVKQPTTRGLITRTPQTSTCIGCHHPPHVGEDWDANQAWQHIIGEGHGR
ncbi:MAG: hypothetical protein KIT72_01785 [Polyangiaceae bacterium]|nr:hypothetical protein [Polyangiaceae bacterium]MCW5789129.1 hypothetical protein [Polyangiaceae bacterium]